MCLLYPLHLTPQKNLGALSKWEELQKPLTSIRQQEKGAQTFQCQIHGEWLCLFNIKRTLLTRWLPNLRFYTKCTVSDQICGVLSLRK